MLMLGAPPFCAYVCTSCSGAGKRVEKHNSSSPGTGKSCHAFLLLTPPQSLTRCSLKADPVRMSLLRTPFSHRMSYYNSELVSFCTRLRRAQRPHESKFITVPSSVAWAVRATTRWCKGMMRVTCGDAVMPGRKPTGGVSWSATAVQVLCLAGWGLLLNDLVRGGEGSRAAVALLQVGQMRCLRGSSARVAVPQVPVREAGRGACGFEHVAKEWMACCFAIPLSLCFFTVQKPFERLPGYQPCLGALVGLLAGSPTTSFWEYSGEQRPLWFLWLSSWEAWCVPTEIHRDTWSSMGRSWRQPRRTFLKGGCSWGECMLLFTLMLSRQGSPLHCI